MLGSRSNQTPLKLGRVELCFTIRVDGDPQEFLRFAGNCLDSEEAGGGPLPVVRVLQPVMSSQSNEWEIRVTHDTFAALGSYIDLLDGRESGTQRTEQLPAILQILNRSEVSLVDKGSLPVFRVWETAKPVPASAASTP